MAFYNDLESMDVVRKKICALADMLKVATVDGTVTAGTITSITVTPTSYSSGEKVANMYNPLFIVDSQTGEVTQVELAADYYDDGTSISITSQVFASDVADGSYIFQPSWFWVKLAL